MTKNRSGNIRCGPVSFGIAIVTHGRRNQAKIFASNTVALSAGAIVAHGHVEAILA